MANIDLKAVDSLEFIILVDNSLEWMTQLPPGFQHEARQHIASNPPIDPLTKAPILDLDNYCCG
jgi:7,8-dihydropterin-6-yl-methyl-4-(beta-D-ribofuranosyl)aminobenzene 5'-phosphate synthase